MITQYSGMLFADYSLEPTKMGPKLNDAISFIAVIFTHVIISTIVLADKRAVEVQVDSLPQELKALLVDLAGNSSQSILSRNQINDLNKLGINRFVIPLFREKSKKVNSPQEKREYTRALFLLKDPIVLDEMLTILNSAEEPSERRQLALEILASSKYNVGLKTYQRILKQEADEDVRKRAVELSGIYRSTSLVHPLFIRAQYDSSIAVRQQALKSLRTYASNGNLNQEQIKLLDELDPQKPKRSMSELQKKAKEAIAKGEFYYLPYIVHEILEKGDQNHIGVVRGLIEFIKTREDSGISARKRNELIYDALSQLLEHGDKSAEKQLEDMVSDDHWGIDAATTLARRGNRVGMDALEKRLRSHRSLEAMSILVDQGRNDLMPFFKTLTKRHGRPGRLGLIYAIEKFGNTADFQLLYSFLEEPYLRRFAAIALLKRDKNKTYTNLKTKPVLEMIDRAVKKEESFSYMGKRYQKVVSLEEYFRWPAPTQSGGSCHVFAAVSLFEAACKRVGIDVNVSEAYLFYRHLRTKIEKLNLYSYREHNAEQKKDPGVFTYKDGGYAYDNLNKMIVDRSICSDKKFPFEGEFKQLLSNLQKFGELSSQSIAREERHEKNRRNRPIAKYSRPSFEKAFKNTFCSMIDGHMRCRFDDEEPALNGGYFVAPKDPELLRCLDKIKPPKKPEPFTIERALDLLSQGIPFLCSKVKRFRAAKPVPHVNVIYGYHHVPNRNPPFVWMVRDSNSKDPKFWSSSCDKIIYLD